MTSDISELAVAMSGMGILRIDCLLETVVADERAAELFDVPSNQELPLTIVRDRIDWPERDVLDFHFGACGEIEAKQTGEFGGSDSCNTQCRVVHRDGRVRWLQIRSQVISGDHDGQQRSVSINLAAIDITEQKQSQDELRRAHETFHHLVEDNPLGLYVIDADMRVRYASQGSREVFKNIVPLIGRDFADVMHTIWPDPFASEAVQHFKHTLATGESYTAPPLVERRVDVDATEAYDWSIYRIVLPDNRYGVVCYFYDATNRQRAEDSIRERESYFREMTNISPAMVWVTDANHRCTFLSQGWCDYTGQNAEDGLEAGWLEIVHPEERERPWRVLLPVLERHERFSHDYRLRTGTGEYRWAIASGRPKFSDGGEFEGYVGSVIDVHERHTVETALLDRARELEISEGRLRLAADATGFGTYDYNVESDVTVWSDQLYRIFQQSPGSTLRPALVIEFIHEQDRSRVQEIIVSAMRKITLDSFQCEYRIVRPSGEIRWVLDSGRVIFDGIGDQQTPIRVIGTLQDITDRKLHEVSLEEAKRIAETANRSRGEFLANMSHEIRTPMAAILGHADILRDHLTDPDNLQVVETIRRNGNFLLEIINDILDLSKIDAGRMEVERRAVRPDAVVAEVRSLMDVRAAEKHLPLTIEFTGPIPETIESDAIRLRQILVNLVGNAIKFTDDGEVRLVIGYHSFPSNSDPFTSDEPAAAGQFQVHETNSGLEIGSSTGILTFEVVDTGIGIERAKIDRLFEPFTQADNTSTRSFGGTGLGLTICRRLARILGGDISVESTPGVGSRFTLAIDAQAPGQLVEPNLSLDIKSETPDTDIRLDVSVLVVDDRRDIRYLAQHFIERAGGRVFTATNGQEAIDFIANPFSPPIDLIVMDMQMPIMDGYDATAELRRKECDLPIIALTANAMKSDRDKCLDVGCNDYTTKPLDSAKLVAMIARLSQAAPQGTERSQNKQLGMIQSADTNPD